MKLISILISLSFWVSAQAKAEESLIPTTTNEPASLAEAKEDGLVVAQMEEKKKKKKRKKKKKKMEKRESLHEQFSGQGYGMAGCGLGSIVFGDQGGIIQVIAVTLNSTAGSQTFGITSGTSNCGGGDTTGAYQFIEVNKLALASEISRGEGETIDNLTKILGCSDNKAVGEVLQRNFVEIYPNENVTTEQIGNAIFNTLKVESENGLTCKIIG